MAKKPARKTSPSKAHDRGITEITVAGFKSITTKQSIEIRPLTILAGANSSGKSSMIQPLLLLKQTLEETFDPGAILLSGANLRFSSVDQFLTHTTKTRRSKSLIVGLKLADGQSLNRVCQRSH